MLGASDARIITSDIVVVDERVQVKCMYPKCEKYGTCANCPPHTIAAGQTRDLLKKYSWALLVKLEVPTSVMAEAHLSPAIRANLNHYLLKCLEIISNIEAQAFYDGYHFALGFGVGSCKNYFCPAIECTVLKGEPCRQPLKARPSMEAVGVDVYTTATRAGWDMYPIGRGTDSSQVPCGSAVGVVFVK